MNDINWREFDDDGFVLLRKNPFQKILVLTDVTIRVAHASEVDENSIHGPAYFFGFGEKGIKFAFIG